MSETSDAKQPTQPGAPAETAPGLPAYEPPAIAWEEALEAMAATSCALVPLDPGCLSRTTV